MSTPTATAIGERYAPELVIGFVAPTGSNFDVVVPALASELARYGYQARPIRLSELLTKHDPNPTAVGTQGRTIELQNAGNRIRAKAGTSACAYIAVHEIRRLRSVEQRASLPAGLSPDDTARIPVPAIVYVIWSLKTPDEVGTLREIYGRRFSLISVYTPRETRVERYAERLAEHDFRTHDHIVEAHETIERDESESELDFGQRSGDTYPLADFFVDATSSNTLTTTLHRFVSILFGDLYATPTRSEYAMFAANAAAMRSSELGRQVGSAVATPMGDIVATGTNEVPAAFGGHYWTGDEPDAREFHRGRDTSDERRRKIIDEAFESLGPILKKDTTRADVIEALRSNPVNNLTEFGRAVHAEMSALMDAARRGVAVAGCDLFVTTYPCHNCSRHIVAAGIARVHYIYPYAKSLAAEFHADSIQSQNLGILDGKRVPFLPFIGVAPRKYLDAFTMKKRKSGPLGKVMPHPQKPPLTEGQEWDLNIHVLFEEEALKRSESWIAQAVRELEEEDGDHGAEVGSVPTTGSERDGEHPSVATVDAAEPKADRAPGSAP